MFVDVRRLLVISRGSNIVYPGEGRIAAADRETAVFRSRGVTRLVADRNGLTMLRGNFLCLIHLEAWIIDAQFEDNFLRKDILEGDNKYECDKY